jgi:hypothetical protein
MEILICPVYTTYDGYGPALEIPGIGIVESKASLKNTPFKSVILTKSQLLKLQYQIAQELFYGQESTME